MYLTSIVQNRLRAKLDTLASAMHVQTWGRYSRSGMYSAYMCHV